MKKLLLLALVSSVANAEVKTIWDSIKDSPSDYLIPCSIAVLGGMAIGDDGLQYGAVGCLAATSVIYSNKKDLEMFEYKVQDQVSNHMKLGLVKMKYDLQSDLEGHVMKQGLESISNKFKEKVLEDVKVELNSDREELKKVLESFAMNLEDYKQQVFKSLSARMDSVGGEVGEEVQSIMMDTEFLSVLEKKIAQSMKGLASEAIEEKKHDIISECVRLSLKELHESKVGVSN